MNAKLLSAFFAFSLALAPIASHAEGLLCSRVFLGTGLAGKYQEYKILKQGRQMIRALKNGNLAVDEWTANYFLHQIGPRLALKDYLLLSRGERESKLLSRMIQEKYASGGLLELESSSLIRLSLSRKDRVLRTFFEWSRSPFGQIWRLPLDLPILKDRPLNKDTAEKWITEGLDRHRPEVEQYLRHQGYVEGYNRFRSLWQKSAMTILFVFVYNEVNDRYEDYENKVKEKVKDSLEEALNKAEMDGVLIAYAEKAFQILLDKFRARYGEPTAEEVLEMRQIAYQEYGLPLP